MQSLRRYCFAGKIVPVPCRCLLYAVVLSLLFLLSSCAGTVATSEEHQPRTWTCDKEADKALKASNYKRSLTLHEAFLKREPHNALALYHLGYTYGGLGYHEKEINLYEEAISLGLDGDDIFFNLGMAFGELRQYEKSIGAFQRGLALTPQNVDLILGKAIVCRELGRDREAENALLQVIRMETDHIEARLLLAMLYAEKDQREKALEHLNRILTADPNHEQARDLMKTLERTRDSFRQNESPE